MNVEILDTTLRDGEQTSGVSFSASEKLSIVRLLLEELHIPRIEIASARVSDGEFEAVRNVCAWAKRMGHIDKLEVLGFIDNGLSINWVKSVGAKVINLLSKGSEKHCLYQLKKTPQEHFQSICDEVERNSMTIDSEIRAFKINRFEDFTSRFNKFVGNVKKIVTAITTELNWYKEVFKDFWNKTSKDFRHLADLMDRNKCEKFSDYNKKFYNAELDYQIQEMNQIQMQHTIRQKKINDDYEWEIQDVFMDLITDEKIRTKVLRSALKEYDFKLDSWIRCIHCGKVFQGDEMRVFKKDDSHLVYCKFPSCDGSIIDIVDADDEDFSSMFG